jgi:hypothetical protein
VFGIADGDVARDAFDVAGAGPMSEGSGRVEELPLALGGEGVNGWDTCEGGGV